MLNFIGKIISRPNESKHIWSHLKSMGLSPGEENSEIEIDKHTDPNWKRSFNFNCLRLLDNSKGENTYIEAHNVFVSLDRNDYLEIDQFDIYFPDSLGLGAIAEEKRCTEKIRQAVYTLLFGKGVT